ncbi:MAG: MaoC family dehydratase [Anaerolineae bacterium]|nr:MaoC family dehydratase [Anaerolineae bacterium]
MPTIEVGMKATRTKTIGAEDVETFARITDDHNPVHLDDAYAATTRFGKRIAHGMLTAGLISALLANDLPGPGCVYMSQSLKFKAPVYLGETVTAVAEVTAFRPDRKIATLSTNCYNQDGKLVIEGEAVVLVP